MSHDAEDGTGSDELTIEDAAPRFEAYLSALEDGEASETPPTQESPASESDDAEGSSEPPKAEDAPAETDEESEEQPETPDDDTLDPNLKVRVKIDGVDTEVTLEEALKGYSRQADYTRKTQELANQRKTQEAEFEAVRGERQKYAELMVQLEQTLQAVVPQEPDWARVQQEQPEEFPALWAQWNQQQKELQAVSAERERAQREVQRDQAHLRQQQLQAEQAKLVEAIPAWRDAEVAKAEKAALVSYAESIGFTREELAQVVDHRPLVMLRKAMLYDKAQAQKPAIQQRIQKVRSATPGPTPQDKRPVSEVTRARQRLAKTGRIEDAAAGFASMLGDDL